MAVVRPCDQNGIRGFFSHDTDFKAAFWNKGLWPSVRNILSSYRCPGIRGYGKNTLQKRPQKSVKILSRDNNALECSFFKGPLFDGPLSELFLSNYCIYWIETSHNCFLSLNLFGRIIKNNNSELIKVQLWPFLDLKYRG